MIYDMMCLLTAIGLASSGSSTVHIYTQIIHRTTQLIWKSAGRAPSLYPRIRLTTEEKAWKNISQGSRRVPVGTMKTVYAEQNIHNNKNT